ncbi:MAG: ABC transporter permease [Archangiaceae bacterium]|nr:ABC transporter permease [Archangiaceae bacterium]
MLADLRFGFRNLLRTPGFTLTALLALALGIGANSAIFSVVSPLLFRALPLPEPEQVVALPMTNTATGNASNWSLPTFKDVLDRQKSFSAMAALRQGGAAVSTATEPARMRVIFASHGVFAVMGLQPELGRVFTETDDQPGAAPVAVLTHSAWVKHWSQDPGVIGRSITVDGRAFTIVGVMPAAFSELPGDGRAQGLFLPLGVDLDEVKFGAHRGHHNLRALARLKAGVTLAAAGSELGSIFSALELEHPEEKNIAPQVLSLQESLTADLKPAAMVLFAAVLLVLLIACANVAGLMVVRSGARQREIAVRLALGASRLRVVQQVLAEAVLLGVMGAALGLLVAVWTLEGLKGLAGSKLSAASLDGQVLLFTAAVGVLTGLLFGAVPALHASRVGLHEALKDAGARASLSKNRRRAQSALVTVQVALAFALLAGAGLMFQSLYGLMRVNPGFEAENLLTVRLDLPASSYTDDQKRDYYRRALEQAAALPGVESVASVDPFPFLDGTSRNSVYPPGNEPERGSEVAANMYEVSAGYFATMKIPVVEGRGFADSEMQLDSPRVMVVSQKLAKRFWPTETALGKQLIGFSREPCTIVGVVGDVKHGSLDGDAKMAFYLPYVRSAWLAQRLLVRAKGPPEQLVASLRRLERNLDPSLPVREPEAANEILSQSASQQQTTLTMLAAFAAVALLLSAIGLWGLIAYAVAQRRQELAIRSALGAPQGHLVGLVLKQGVWLTGLGLLGGVALALAGSKVLGAMLYGITAVDPKTYLTIGVVLAAVALLACWLPARTAARVDPNAALRA